MKDSKPPTATHGRYRSLPKGLTSLSFDFFVIIIKINYLRSSSMPKAWLPSSPQGAITIICRTELCNPSEKTFLGKICVNIYFTTHDCNEAITGIRLEWEKQLNQSLESAKVCSSPSHSLHPQRPPEPRHQSPPKHSIIAIIVILAVTNTGAISTLVRFLKVWVGKPDYH